jgi:threonine dehydrogenase-like Zn-dependent dehydrogenase
MKHYYVSAPGVIACVDETTPEPGPDDVQVRVTHTAVSPGSNSYIFQTGSYSGSWGGVPQDCVYMGSGVVTAVGEGVIGVSVGEPVSMNGVGHQEMAVLPRRKVHMIPPGVSPEAASLSYLAGWAVSALHLGNYAAGHNVAVVGLGLVGVSAAMVADMMGARVLALDVAPERIAFASTLGLGAVVQVGSPDTEDRISEFVGPRGVDLILETSGVWSGFEQAFSLARDYTRIALMGLYRKPPDADYALKLHRMLYGFPSKLHYQKIEIVGCGYDPEESLPDSPYTFTREANYAYLLEQAGRGKIDLSKLVTHRFRPDEIEPVLHRFSTGDKSMVGAVFEWTSFED